MEHACGYLQTRSALESEVDDGVEDDDGPRSSSRCSSRPEDFARKSCFLWRRYIRRYRAAATQPDPGSFLPPPPADNEKSRVRMVVTQSAPVAASCSAIHNKLFV